MGLALRHTRDREVVKDEDLWVMMGFFGFFYFLFFIFYFSTEQDEKSATWLKPSLVRRVSKQQSFGY